MSVLFCDLVGFTTLSESRDAEDVRELLSEYFTRARAIIARYGGTVEKFIGDAVMAVWGVPSAHEDDAERAVRAGLDLIDAVSILGENHDVPGLTARAGITTDEVAVSVGAVGEGMVAGDPVNTAARIQALATPGSVWCDSGTAGLIATRIRSRIAGRHQLKGRTVPLDLCSIDGVLPGGAERTDAGLEVPLVGRRRDAAVLREVFHAVEEERRPRIVIVNGPPGVGKSRLVHEWEEYIEALPTGVLWHRGRCLSYGEGVAFSGLSAAVRVRLGVLDSDDAETIAGKLHASLERLSADEGEVGWIEKHLSRLLGIGHGSDIAAADRDDAFSAWARWFQLLCGPNASTPLVWVVDDAQQADTGLLDFIDHLVSTVSFPGLVVLVTRPELLEGHPRLASQARTTVVNVQLLTETEIGALITRLIDGLPSRVHETLVRRAEGNPLFAVETVRALHARGLIEMTEESRSGAPMRVRHDADLTGISMMDAPISLQVLIASRLDLLDAAQRRVVSAGAVLGQAFTLAGLRSLTGQSAEDIQTVLAELIARDVFVRVHDRLSADGGRITFVQPSVRDVAYAQQSRRDRAALHLAAAEHLQEETTAEGELSAVIAQHLRDARALVGTQDPQREPLSGRLLRWLNAALHYAASVNGFPEVLTLGAEILELAAEEAIEEVEVAVRVAMGEAAMSLSSLDTVVDILNPVLTSTSHLDHRARAAALSARAHSLRGDTRNHWRVLEPFLDPEGMEGLNAGSAATVSLQIMLWFETRAEWEQALIWHDRMLTLAERSGQPAVLASILCYSAQSTSLRGQHIVGRELRRLAVDYAREHHLTAQLAHSLLVALIFEVETDLDSAVEIGYDAIATATAAGNRPSREQAVSYQALALRTAGRWEELDALLESQPGIEDWIADLIVRVQQALAADARGDRAAAQVALDTALRNDVDGIDRLWITATHSLRAYLSGSLDDALDLAEELIASAHHYCRLVDEYPHHLGMVGPWFLEAGQHERLHRLIWPAMQAQPFALSPLLRNQLQLLVVSTEPIGATTASQ